MDGLYIGIMTGTSLDAVDLVLAEFIGAKMPQVLATRRHPLPAILRQNILTLCSRGETTLSSLGQLDVALGACYTDGVLALLQPLQISTRTICALGCHGQTIWHQPEESLWPFTMQIGDPNRLAAQTGISVVSDFRRRDVAEGGLGAPLAPAFHAALFGHHEVSRLIVNIGGFANISVLNHEQPGRHRGYDTGPGNVLLDYWIGQQGGQRYDDQGAWAGTGKVLPDLLSRLLSDPYFVLEPPKSTGRERFNARWLNAHLSLDQDAADVQATLLALTAQTIARAVKYEQRHVVGAELVLCGGGVHNQELVLAIQHELPGVRVIKTDELGISADWVEAVGFAWLARERMAGRKIDLSGVTDAKRPAPLGAVYLA